MASHTLRSYFVWLLPLICLVAAAPSTTSITKCLGSPVALRSSLIGGRATITLPAALMSLKLTVAPRLLERDGAMVLRLYPVMVDEKKCITQIQTFVHMCYEYSEIHWGKTNEEGSDHSLNGYSYPMEIQHYFHRTNTTHSITPLAVAVFVNSNQHLHLSSVSPGSLSNILEQSLGNLSDFQPQNRIRFFSSHEILKKEERIHLNIGNLLPKNFTERKFYQYRGSLPGTCADKREWIVFEDPISVPYSFLETLRRLNTSDLPNHFKMPHEYRCLLHSHDTSDANTCDDISPVTEAMNVSAYKSSSAVNENANFVDGARDTVERIDDKTASDATGLELDIAELNSGYRSSISHSTYFNSSLKIAGNRNVRSETDAAKVSSAADSSASVRTEASSLSKSPGELKPAELVPNVTRPTASYTSSSTPSPSPVYTTRLITSQTSPTVNSTEVLRANSSAVPIESSTLSSEKNKSHTSVVVISAPIGRENVRNHENAHPSGRAESRSGNGEPELVTSRDSIQDIRKGKGNPSVSPPVTASVRSLNPEIIIVLLNILIHFY